MESVNGIHNMGGNLRHDKSLHTLRGKTKQSKTGGWSKNSTREEHEILWKAVDAYIQRGVEVYITRSLFRVKHHGILSLERH